MNLSFRFIRRSSSVSEILSAISRMIFRFRFFKFILHVFITSTKLSKKYILQILEYNSFSPKKFDETSKCKQFSLSNVSIIEISSLLKYLIIQIKAFTLQLIVISTFSESKTPANTSLICGTFSFNHYLSKSNSS